MTPIDQEAKKFIAFIFCNKLEDDTVQDTKLQFITFSHLCCTQFPVDLNKC